MTPFYVQATGEYEEVELFNETVEEFCKRMCVNEGVPIGFFELFSESDNWQQLFYEKFTDYVICGDSVYRLYDVNESLANGDEGSIIGDNSFVLYYDNNKHNLRDAFQINK